MDAAAAVASSMDLLDAGSSIDSSCSFEGEKSVSHSSSLQELTSLIDKSLSQMEREAATKTGKTASSPRYSITLHLTPFETLGISLSQKSSPTDGSLYKLSEKNPSYPRSRLPEFIESPQKEVLFLFCIMDLMYDSGNLTETGKLCEKNWQKSQRRLPAPFNLPATTFRQFRLRIIFLK